jgi:hypothetical protein
MSALDEHLRCQGHVIWHGVYIGRVVSVDQDEKGTRYSIRFDLGGAAIGQSRESFELAPIMIIGDHFVQLSDDGPSAVLPLRS